MKHHTKRAALAGLSALLVLAFAPAAHAKTPRPLTFIAIMNGGQVVPPTTTNALGLGFLTFDNQTKRLCYSLTYSGMLGTETEAHLHGDALPGQTNQVLYDLNPYGSPKVSCLGPLKPNEERLLKQEKMYIQIHTDIFVAGEIRGQVLSIR
jgi:CHRD domain-containing protein